VIPANLKTALAENGPKILVLDAADLNIAAFDPFPELIPLAKAAGAWIHIDGAFGLFARASRAKRHLTKGLELADSWATDGHKWLNVPFDCGIAIIKNRAAHREAMTISASYIASETQARDQIDWNPEWSRRARGIPVYAALRELGRNGLEDLIDRTSRHCHTLVTEMARLPGIEMLWEPQLNQGLVRFLDQTPNATDADHDTRTTAMIAAINATGEAFFSPTLWKGKKAMRVSVVTLENKRCGRPSNHRCRSKNRHVIPSKTPAPVTAPSRFEGFCPCLASLHSDPPLILYPHEERVR
jgi:glutamate/tyrosine decarboxylase-like PLP-dependent enzyme